MGAAFNPRGCSNCFWSAGAALATSGPSMHRRKHMRSGVSLQRSLLSRGYSSLRVPSLHPSPRAGVPSLYLLLQTLKEAMVTFAHSWSAPVPPQAFAKCGSEHGGGERGPPPTLGPFFQLNPSPWRLTVFEWGRGVTYIYLFPLNFPPLLQLVVIKISQ